MQGDRVLKRAQLIALSKTQRCMAFNKVIRNNDLYILLIYF